MQWRGTGLGTATKVPATWRVVRNGALFMERRDKNHPDLEMYSVTQSRGVVAQSSLESRVTAPSDDRSGYNRICQGDLVYNKMRMWQGAVGVAPAEGIVSTAYVVMTPRADVNSRYYEYLYRTPEFIAESSRFSYGLCDDMNSLRAEHFKAMLSPAPPPEVQDRITNYLDSETARIDALIDRKQRFIDLLLEKRTALIAHAATKGLDPNVEMKDSGHDEIGQVPAHWHVMRVRHLFRNLDGRRIPLSAEERSYRQGQYPYYGASGVIDQVDDYLFDETLVLIGEDGANLLRRSTPLAFVASGRYWVNNHAHILQPLLGFPRYWAAALNVIDYTPLIVGSAQPKLTQSDLADVPLPVPPVHEMATICKHIDAETSEIDKLVSKTRRSIELLREYRIALISAAVTGQIDIPGTETSEEVA